MLCDVKLIFLCHNFYILGDQTEPLTPNKIRRALKIRNVANISCILFVRARHKLRRLGADSFIFSIATPVFGTELYEQAKRGGFLRDCFSDEALAAAEPLIETPEFTADDLRRLCAQANLVNPTFARDKLINAIRNPKKAMRVILRKS